MLSYLRPTTGGSQSHFTARPPPHASRSGTGISQPHIALRLLPSSHGPVTGKAEIGLNSPTQETPGKNTPRGQLQTTPENYLVTPQAAHPKGVHNRHKSPQGKSVL